MEPCFIETAAFTREVMRLGLESDLNELQALLRHHPTIGVVDPGTGGLRKVRMGARSRGQGKRGGARVHYLWHSADRIIYLLWVYAKHNSSTLSPRQKREIRRVAEAIKAGWRNDEGA